jgi:uncharacterized membrane protein
MSVVIALFRIAHILGAIVWMGFGLYNYLVTSRINANMSVTAVNYQLGVAKYTKFGQVMGLAAVITTVAGLALWGVASPHKFLSGLQLAILGIGSLAGLGAFGHGFGLGKRTDALAKALLAAEENGQIPATQHASIESMMAALNKSANISLGMMAVALLCMSTYSTF